MVLLNAPLWFNSSFSFIRKFFMRQIFFFNTFNVFVFLYHWRQNSTEDCERQSDSTKINFIIIATIIFKKVATWNCSFPLTFIPNIIWGKIILEYQNFQSE